MKIYLFAKELEILLEFIELKLECLEIKNNLQLIFFLIVHGPFFHLISSKINYKKKKNFPHFSLTVKMFPSKIMRKR
jgi:hypothetical protein